MSDTFQFTAAEWQSVSDTLDKWADTMLVNQQCRDGYYAYDKHGALTGMCALGALAFSIRGEEHFDPDLTIHESSVTPFILSLVGRTAARQNDIHDLDDGMARHHYDPNAIAYLNDVERLPFVSFAAAVRSTRIFLAEHVVIVEPQPAQELAVRS